MGMSKIAWASLLQGFNEGIGTHLERKSAKEGAALEEELARMKMGMLEEEMGLDREKFEWDKAQDEMDNTLDMAKLRKSLESLKGGTGTVAPTTPATDKSLAIDPTIALFTDKGNLTKYGENIVSKLTEMGDIARNPMNANRLLTSDEVAFLQKGVDALNEQRPSGVNEYSLSPKTGKAIDTYTKPRMGTASGGIVGGTKDSGSGEEPTVNKEERPEAKPSPEEAEKFLRNRFPYKTAPDEAKKNKDEALAEIDRATYNLDPEADATWELADTIAVKYGYSSVNDLLGK